MNTSSMRPVSRTVTSLAAASLLASFSWAQQPPSGGTPPSSDAPPSEVTAADAPKDASQATVVDQAPLRQPPTETGIDGTSVPKVVEKRVLADPATKRYMPCRDANDAKSSDADASPVKLNPKAAVLSEEAAKQHGYKSSPHKVDCPE
jgi:hypothetical protein